MADQRGDRPGSGVRDEPHRNNGLRLCAAIAASKRSAPTSSINAGGNGSDGSGVPSMPSAYMLTRPGWSLGVKHPDGWLVVDSFVSASVNGDRRERVGDDVVAAVG